MSLRFIDEIAIKILEKHSGEMYRVGVFFSNGRLPLYFLHAMQKHRQQTELAPLTENFRQFILRHSPLTEGTELSQITILHDLYREAGGTQEYTDFLPVARQMLRDFDELDEGLVNPNTFFQSLKSLKSLNTFLEEDREQEDAYSRNYAQFWEHFENLYIRSREVFKERGCCTAGMIARAQAEDLSWLDRCGVNHFYLAGFTGMLAFEEKITAEILKRGGSYWVDTDTYYREDSGQEAGFFFRKYAQQFQLNDKDFQLDRLQANPLSIHVIGAPGVMAQCRVSINELHIIQQQTGNLDGVALILADKLFLKPLMQLLPETLGPVNISMGFPMSDAHLGSFIDLILRFYEEEKVFGQKEHIYYKNILLLLKHPYFPMWCTDEQAALQLEKVIFEQNLRFLAPDMLKTCMPEQMLTLIRLQAVGKEFVRLWDQLLSLLLDRLIDREREQQETDLLDSPQFILEFRKNIRGLMNDMREDTPTDMLIPLFRDFIMESSIPFEGNRREGLQVIGLMESRGLDFRQVLILGMNEGKIPGGKSMKTFIPFDLRRVHHLTTQREKDSITAYLFYRLLHRSEKMLLLYGTEEKSFGGGEMSRFIQQLQLELKEKNPQLQFVHERYNMKLQGSNTAPIVVEKTEEVLNKIRKQLTERGLSPTALTGYLDCKLIFYLRTIEGYRESEEMLEYIEDHLLGNGVHKALEELYKPELGKILTEATVSSWLKDIPRIEEYILSIFRESFREEEIHQGRNLIIYRIAVQMTIRFLEAERMRIQQGEVIQVQDVERKLQRSLTWEGSQFIFKGLTDRMDRVNGIVRVADYKTGSVNPAGLAFHSFDELLADNDKAKAIQLLMYAWMADIREPMYSEIIGLKEPHKDFRVMQQKNALLQPDGLTAFEEEFLRPLIAEILNPEVPFDQTADEKICEWCAFKQLCKR